MNFALSTIIIVFLLLPGAIAIRAYYSSLRAKVSNSFVPFNEVLLQGVLASFIIHSSAVCIITKVMNKEIRFNFLYSIILGEDEKGFVFTNPEFTHNFLDFSNYIIACTVSSYLIIKIFKYVVHKFGLDRKYNFLRNANHWFTIFNKEIPGQEIDIMILDVFVKPDIIYTGYLIDFNYSPVKDQLENIVLQYARRRRIITKEEQDETPKVSPPLPIPGNILVLLMDDIININIRYVRVQQLVAQISPDATTNIPIQNGVVPTTP